MPTVQESLRNLRDIWLGGAKVRFESGFPKVINIGTIATEVLPANPNRVAWQFSNKSANPGHYDYGRNVSTSRGFPVAQNGGVSGSKFTDPDGGETVQSSIFGICETAAGDWYIVSWELDTD